MSLSDLASLGTFVSGIAVLVSLIYLALQLRHSDRNQRAAIHQSRLDARTRFVVGSLAGNPSAGLMNRGLRADPTLTELEADQYVLAVFSDLLLYEEWFYQFRDGMIDEARWESSVKTLSFEAAFPGWRAAWLSTSISFQDDFRRVVDEILDGVPVTRESYMAPRWHEFAAAEKAKAAGR